MVMMMMREKTSEKKNKGEIHRDIIENETYIHQYALDKIIIECPDETAPSEME